MGGTASTGIGDLLDGAVDLLLGGRCVGCGRAGRVLCPSCAASLPTGAQPRWPDPVPAGLAPPWAAAEYGGVVRAMVVGHKERRLLALRRPLSRLLAGAVATAVTALPAGPLVLVPVPSRPGSARARGHDPTAAITRGAARLLRADGHDAVTVGLLRSRSGVLDQAGLGAAARSANLAGSMCVRAGSLRSLATRRPRARVVLCDDVITTGATLREAQRALEQVGLVVEAVTAVAATRRRLGAAPGASAGGGPGPLLSNPATD